MKLGTRLMLSFLVSAVVPAGAILVFTWMSVKKHFQSEFQDRLDAVVKVVEVSLQEEAALLQRKISEAAESDLADRLVAGMHAGWLDRSTAIRECWHLMRALEIDALVFMDREGKVLLSGHLPARSGDVDEELLRYINHKTVPVSIRKLQVLQDGSIEEFHAWITSVEKANAQNSLMVVGGWLLTEKFESKLAARSGANIAIVDSDNRPLNDIRMDNGRSVSETLPNCGLSCRKIPLRTEGAFGEVTAYVMVTISDAKLLQTNRQIVIASTFATLLAVCVSWLLGLMISRGILKPVKGLVHATRLVASGNLEKRVEITLGGEIGELVCAFNNMTEELATYRNKLVRAERVAAWQEIARRLAHEIKNPLSPIQMSIETLRKAHIGAHPEFKEIFDESTKAILEEVGALKRIVTEFSQFARLPMPDKKPQDLNRLIDGILSLYRDDPQCDRIHFERYPAVPCVCVDREQIGQLLLNLISNALWASGPEGTVRVTLSSRDGMIWLRVIDDGDGMEPEVLKKVFTPYYTTRSDGTGLGLAIVQRIVQEHDAKLDIESIKGIGTTVMVGFEECEPT